MTSEPSLSFTQCVCISSASTGQKPGPALGRPLHRLFRDGTPVPVEAGVSSEARLGKGPLLQGSSGFVSKCALFHVWGSAVPKVTRRLSEIHMEWVFWISSGSLATRAHKAISCLRASSGVFSLLQGPVPLLTFPVDETDPFHCSESSR